MPRLECRFLCKVGGDPELLDVFWILDCEACEGISDHVLKVSLTLQRVNDLQCNETDA